MTDHDRAPRLDLEWEERVFAGLIWLWRRLFPAAAPLTRPGAVHLADHEPPLRMLASLIAGEPMRVLPAQGEGGVRGSDLLLPAVVDLAETEDYNRQLYVLRVAVGAAIRRQRRAGQNGKREPGPDALAWLDEVLPGFGERLAEARAWVQAPDALDAWLRGVIIPAVADVTSPLSAGDDPAAQPSTGTEREGRPIDEVRRITLDEEKAREQVLVHTFEKVETADSHGGELRKMDGSDELDEHAEALDEVDLRDLIRGGEQAQSVYRAEVGLEADIPDVTAEIPGELGISYDEWDGRAVRYRPGWCTVYPTPVRGGDLAWSGAALLRHARLVDRLRRALERHRTRLATIGRQRDGEEVDIDALLDELALRQAGQGGGDRLYTRRIRRRRDHATTVLLDVSLSSDAWVGGQRVLDVAREAVLVLGEVADALGDPLQVLAFASHTRNRCRVWELRGWKEPWSVGRARLGLLHPQGYTRIGPALRHATAELLRVPADRRLLLLISDGKPTDYDRYEGRYGLADVRQAIREAESRGVVTHGLAVDTVARDALPAMLGPGAWHILPRPELLPEALATVYGRLTG